MRARMVEELTLLRENFAGVEHLEQAGEDWFMLPRYSFPAGWRIGQDAIEFASVAFKILAAYPSAEPYGFLAPAGVNFKGSPPGNAGSAIKVPFSGEWQHFSWQPDGSWAPAHEVRAGSNLLIWARSFAQRLAEGA